MTRFRIWSIAHVIGVVLLVVPHTVHAALYDVQIQRSDVTFVPATFVVGDHVRVYATVKNVGERDVQGSVFFSENGTAIGTPPPFSVRARGAEEEVWVDWQPAIMGERQIFIRIVTAPETRDEEPTNNEMIVPVTVRDRVPPPPPPQSPSTVSGGSGSGASVFGSPSDVTPSATSGPPPSPPSAAPAPAPAPKKTAPTSATAAARTGTSPSTAVIRPAAPAVVLAPATSAPAAAPLPETPTPPPAPPYDEQLRQLLGRPASPWRSALPLAAAGVAVVAVATIVVLRIRHRAHGETQRATSETVDRRPPRTS